MRLAGQFGGLVGTITIVPPLAYVGHGPRLVVLDVSGMGDPRLVGQTSPMADSVVGIAVHGRHAFVAAGDAGLRVFSLSDPSAPREVGHVTVDARGVALYGRYAYVASSYNGIAVIDVARRSAPTLARTVATPGEANGVAIAADVMFVADWDALRIFSLAAPAYPMLIGELKVPDIETQLNLATGLVTSADGRLIVVRDYWRAFVVDASDPTQPRYTGRIGGPDDEIAAVAVAAGLIYVGDLTGTLRVFGPVEGGDPVEIGRLDVGGGWVTAIAAAEGRVLLADRAHPGIRIVDVAEPGSPRPAGFLRLLSFDGDLAVAGDRAYVYDHYSPEPRLHILDVSSSLEPSWIASLTVQPVEGMTNGTMVGVVGTSVFLAHGNYHGQPVPPRWILRVVDASDPRGLLDLGSVGFDMFPDVMAVQHDRVYVAGQWDNRTYGLTVIDVSVPVGPAVAGRLVLEQRAMTSPVSLAVQGDLVFVGLKRGTHTGTEGPGTLVVVDTSIAAEPRELSRTEVHGNVYGLAVGGRFAYLAAGVHGLIVVDVSNPHAPRQMGHLPFWGYAYDVLHAEGHAYIQTDSHVFASDAIEVVNVTVPERPEPIGRLSLPEDAFSGLGDRMCLVGPHLWIRTASGGVRALQ